MSTGACGVEQGLMWGAALTRACRSALIASAAVFVVAITAPASSAGVTAPVREQALPSQIWAIEVTRGFSRSLGTRIALQLRLNGVNAIVASPKLTRRELTKTRALAARWQFDLLVPIRLSARTTSNPGGVEAACRALKQADPSRSCIVSAPTVASALAAAKTGGADLVVITFRGPQELRKLAMTPTQTRILAIPTLTGTRRFAARDWQLVIRFASVNTQLDLGVSPRSNPNLQTFVRLLGGELIRSVAAMRDTTPPSAPYIRGGSATVDSVSLAWRPSGDRTGVGAYLLYRNGQFVAMTAGTTTRHKNLTCGTRYAFHVEAVDLAGNRSPRTPLEMGTRGCRLGTPRLPNPTPVAPAQPVPTPGPSPQPAPSEPPVVGPKHPVGPPPTASPSNPTTPVVPNPTSPGPISPPPTFPPALPGVPAPSAGTRYVSTAGSDANLCSMSSPCLSFDRAYRVAQPGELVEVAAGSYAGQTIRFDPSKTSSADVTFLPAAGASVAIAGNLVVLGAHLEVREMTVMAFEAQYRTDVAGYRAEDVTFRNLTARGCFLNAPQDVTITGGSVGPNLPGSDDGCYIGAYPSTRVPTNIVIDGVRFRDILRANSGRADPHSDCLQITAGANVVVRNSRFENCDDADLMVQTAQGPLSNITIENNFLDDTNLAYWSINLYAPDACSNIVIRNNSALENIRVDACAGNGLIFRGNIQPSMSSYLCSLVDGVADWNVYESGVTCGPNDLVGPVGYVNRSAFDLRLLSGAPRDRISSSGICSSNDIDGQARPRGGACDAGADEN